MSNELAVRNDIGLSQLGTVLAQCGYFADARQEAQAIVKVLAGQELGFGPIASMTGIYIVKGRVTLSANLMAAAVKRSNRYDYRVLTLTDQECDLAFSENGELLGHSSFTMDDAKRAGLNSQTWTAYPRNMLFSRAISNGVKIYCPDVTNGPAYTPDELGATVDGATGEIIIEAEVIEQPAPTESMPSPREDPPQPQPISDSLPSIDARPWPAAGTCRVIEKKVAEKRAEGFAYADEDERGKRRWTAQVNLEKCFAGDSASTEKRHLVSVFVTGKSSSKDWDDAEIETLRKWLGITKGDDGDYSPSVFASLEAKAMARAAQIAEGQAELDI